MGRAAGRCTGAYNNFDHVEIILEENLRGIYAGRVITIGRQCGSYEDYQPLQDQLYFFQARIIKELAEMRGFEQLPFMSGQQYVWY